MAVKTIAFDAAKYLKSERAQIELISDALRTGNAGYIAAAIGTVARARGMTELAKETGLKRQSLYKALSEKGDPQLTTLLGVFNAMGLELRVKARARTTA